MSLTDGIEGLTEAQIEAINGNAAKQYEGYESPDSVAGLKKAKDDLLAEKKAVEEAKLALAKEAEDKALEAARAKGDIKTLEESWKQKQAESDERYNSLLKQNETSAINGAAAKLAAELGGESADLLEPHLKARLRYEDGKVKVVDADGSLTVSTISDLATEFKSNPAFAKVIVGSKASGGGAATQSSSGGATGGNKKYADMSLQERADHLAKNPPQRK